MAQRLAITAALGALAVSAGAVALSPTQAGATTNGRADLSIGASGQVNLAGVGLVPVEIRSTDTVDATAIDLRTLVLGDGAAPARGPAGDPIASVTDVDADGRDDVVVHVDTAELIDDGGLTSSTERLAMSARTSDGGTVEATGQVRPEVVLEVRLAGDDPSARMATVLDRYGAERLTPFLSDAAARRLAENAGRAAKAGVVDLAAWHTLTLPGDTDVTAAVADLEALPEVSHAEPAPAFTPPPQADVPETPDFTGMQRYFRSAAENGIDADFSRADPRIRGEGIKIVDLEYDWNEHHEDLQLPDPGTDVGGDAFEKYTGFNDQHGTAVLGILGAIENDYGVTGGVPDADLYGISPVRANGQYAAGAALAYLAALQDPNGDPFLRPGDAVLLEQQGGQVIPDADCPVEPGTCYSPLEWNVAVHDAVTLLTSMGVTVVATGGNGYNSTENPAYTRNGLPWFRPENRSGSIFVGAADSETRERLAYSNHGSRFDLQGWGHEITTTGHGGTSTDFWPPTGGDDPATLDYRYTDSFGGTSGAGPIVTTAVVAVQSYLKATGQGTWSADQIAGLLQATGQPQGPDPETEHIGPLPDLRAALTSIEVDDPESTLLLDGRPVRPRPYFNPVVTLEADDGWGSGVRRIKYRVDHGGWRTYDDPFRVRGVGLHVIRYRAVDVNGNAEKVETVVFLNLAHSPS
jgi:Subtilase family